MRPVSSVYLLIPRPVWEFKYRTGEKERGGGEDEEERDRDVKKAAFRFHREPTASHNRRHSQDMKIVVQKLAFVCIIILCY